MDDEIAAMLADLGHGRRDAVVAPEDRKGLGIFRNEYEKMLDAEEELLVRQQQLKLAGPAQNAKHARLQQWNTATTFGMDDVAARQQDRYGGQGHRSRMKVEILKYHRNPDGSDAGRGGGGNRGGGGGGGFRGNRGMFCWFLCEKSDLCLLVFGLTGFTGAIPHQFCPPPPPPPPVVRRAPAPVPQRRAYSPRRAGFTRFIKVEKAMPTGAQHLTRQNPRLGGDAQQIKENLPKGPAAVAARLRKEALQQGTESHATLPQAAPIASPVLSSTKLSATEDLSPKTATSSIIENFRAQLRGMAPLTGHLPTVPVPAAASPLPRPAALPKSAPSTNGARDQVRESAVIAHTPAKICAIAAAETPNFSGIGNDAQLLREARQELAQDVVRLAAKPESEEASRYFTANKHRAWLLQPAIDALHDVSPENVADYTIQAIVEHAAIVRQKAESLPSPPLSAERGRKTSRSALSSLGAPISFGAKVGGVISVDYYDAEGNHHKNERFEVSQPVNASVTVASKAGQYDPLGMARQMEALAQRMVQHF